ncbi:MAG: hypothetical protein ACUVQG_08790 [Thermogutta sp.]
MLCQNTRDELFRLLDALLNETISPEQFHRLEAILLAEAEARQIFRQYLKLHQQLRTLAQAWAEEKLIKLAEGPVPENSAANTAAQLGQGVVHGLLFALGIAALAGIWWFRHIRAEPPAPHPVNSQPVCQVDLVSDLPGCVPQIREVSH